MSAPADQGPDARVAKTPRRLARELAMQGLYQWRMSGNSLPVVEEFLEQEQADWSRADRKLLLSLLRGAAEQADTLELAFAPFLDRPLPELSPIERAVLLLAAYELSQCMETPYRVIINEAIELTKGFGGTDGHKFVNGVLDKLAARLRAPEVQAAAAGRRPGRRN